MMPDMTKQTTAAAVVTWDAWLNGWDSVGLQAGADIDLGTHTTSAEWTPQMIANLADPSHPVNWIY